MVSDQTGFTRAGLGGGSRLIKTSLQITHRAAILLFLKGSCQLPYLALHPGQSTEGGESDSHRIPKPRESSVLTDFLATLGDENQFKNKLADPMAPLSPEWANLEAGMSSSLGTASGRVPSGAQGYRMPGVSSGMPRAKLCFQAPVSPGLKLVGVLRGGPASPAAPLSSAGHSCRRTLSPDKAARGEQARRGGAQPGMQQTGLHGNMAGARLVESLGAGGLGEQPESLGLWAEGGSFPSREIYLFFLTQLPTHHS